jgi:predicted O-methyltransferase YrrM
LNSRFIQKLRLAGRFSGFLISSGNRYRVHSPFLYQMICEVIRNNKPVEGEDKIEMLRKECLQNRSIIFKTDFGTGAGGSGSKKYPVTVRSVARRSLASRKEARRLSRMVSFVHAGRILELGTSLGITTAYLAKANPGARIITLEGCPELSKMASNHFSGLDLKNITVRVGRFEDTLGPSLEELEKVDLVFIDGNHRGEALLNYFNRCLGHANNNTVIVIDDIHASPSMERAWETICRDERVRVSLDLFYSGWVFLRKESSKQHFKLRYV